MLKLVRGTSPDGEVVDRWTVGKEPHRLRLEVGDYLLIQESVPEGYTIAEPVAFSLKEGEGGVSGSNFVAYERSVKPYGDDQSSVSFYLSKEGDPQREDRLLRQPGAEESVPDRLRVRQVPVLQGVETGG